MLFRSVRPAISLLTVGSFPGLLRYCLDKKLIVKSLMVTGPEFLDIKILPTSVKQQYLAEYHTLLDELEHVDVPTDYNASDPNNFVTVVKEQAQMCVNILNLPQPPNTHQLTQLTQQLVDHCRRWDQVYDLNARELYPELTTIWNDYGY